MTDTEIVKSFSIREILNKLREIEDWDQEVEIVYFNTDHNTITYHVKYFNIFNEIQFTYIGTYAAK